MKKKLLAVALCLCTAFSVVACNEDGAKDSDTTNASDTKTEGKITLGEYKGIKVDASLKEVSEEDLQAYLDSVLEAKAETEEITDAVLAKDDVVKLDYTCYVDDKEYNAAAAVEVTLNDTGFVVDGFVDGVIGKKCGEEFELKLKFADDFQDNTVAGKDTTFKVKLIAKVNTIIPEFTDEFVAKNFDYLNLSTKDDLREYLSNDIVINQVYQDIWEAVVIKNATADSYDSEDLKAMTAEYSEYQQYYIYQMTGWSLADYLAKVEMSQEEFDKQMEDMAKTYLKQEMVVNAIAEAEGIVITDEVYATEMLEFAKSYGFDTVEEFEEAYKDSMTKEDFEFTILTYLVEELVCTSVEYVEGQGLYVEPETEAPTTSDTETGSTSGEDDTTQETTTAATK